MSRYGAWCGRGVPLMPSINLPVRRGRVVVATDCDCLKNCPFVLIQRVAQVCQRGARLSAGRWYDSGTGQSRAGLGAWPVAFDTGPSQTLLCSWVQFDLRLQFTKIVQDMICAKFRRAKRLHVCVRIFRLRLRLVVPLPGRPLIYNSRISVGFRTAFVFVHQPTTRTITGCP